LGNEIKNKPKIKHFLKTSILNPQGNIRPKEPLTSKVAQVFIPADLEEQVNENLRTFKTEETTITFFIKQQKKPIHLIYKLFCFIQRIFMTAAKKQK